MSESDFQPGVPVIIEGRQADIVHADDNGIIAESVLPVKPGESRHLQWTIPMSHVVEAVQYDVERDFHQNGQAMCDDCGLRMRVLSLESLPGHGCLERQQARAAFQHGEG